MPGFIIALFAIGMVFGIPIIAIMLSHQQKMAMIYRSDEEKSARMPEVQQLRQEVQELKQAVNQITIQMDDLLAIHRTSPPLPPLQVQDRLRAL